MDLGLAPHADGVTVDVRVVVRAQRTALAGLHHGALRVRVASPPVDGAANEALTTYLAGVFGVRRSAVELLRGDRARRKVVLIRGVSVAAAEAAITHALDG